MKDADRQHARDQRHGSNPLVVGFFFALIAILIVLGVLGLA
jgi:hypothetical protein